MKAPRRLRVLQAVLDLESGGLERMVASLMRSLPRSDFETHLLALNFLGRHASGLEEVGPVHVVRSRAGASLLWPRALTRAIREIAPDVVHTHSGVWFKVSLAARRAGVPRLVHTDHGRLNPDPLSYRIADHFASRRTDVVVAVSEALGAQMRRTVVGSAWPITVIPNGIDTAEFSRDRTAPGWKVRHGIDPDRPVLVTVGRLDAIKCYDVMLRAFSQVVQAGTGGLPPILVVAGDGPEEAHLKGLAQELRLGDAVRWLGWTDDVRDLLADAAAFTLSSRSEGTSMSLLEAMSLGVCPVVTNVGGNPAVLGSVLAHRLVPSGDVAGLADAYRRVLEREGERREDAAQARRRVEEAFSLGAMVRAYASIYLGGGNGYR